MEAVLDKPKIDYALYPKEVLAELQAKKKQINVGIPKETNFQERRIGLTPNSVTGLISYGAKIIIETGAGNNAKFTDQEYLEAGANIVSTKEELFQQADTIIKTAPLSLEELQLIRPNSTILSPILLPSQSKLALKQMIEKKLLCLAFEYIKGDYGTFPFRRSMSEIAGNYALFIAAKYLSNDYGKGILLGGIAGQPPAKVLIIGAGTVGENAAKTALALGASVQVFDDNIYKLSRLQNDLGLKLYTSVLDPINLAKNCARADVVIGALQPQQGKTPIVLTEDMIKSMKKGSVFVDISIDSGGCSETSRVTNHNEPIYVVHDVIHYCVPNIASTISRTASYALSNILTPILKKIIAGGGIENSIKLDKGIRQGCYLYKGAITKDFIAKQFDLKYTNLELLLSADF